MPRVNVVTQTLANAGTTPAHTAPTVDNDVVDVGRNFLSVINGAGASITVTVETPGVVDGDLAVADRSVVVPVSSVPKLIPLTSPNYRQPASAGADSGRAYVNYSAIASVTRAVVKLT